VQRFTKRLRQSVVSLTCKLITKEETLSPRILLLWLKTPRCRGVITGRIRPPIQGRVLRSRVDAHEEPVNRPVDRRIWRGVDEHAALQQIKPHAQPPSKQMKSSGVQSVINGEDRNVKNVYNTGPVLITCDNKTDICISKSTKDKIWNFEYTDLSLLVRHNFNCQCVKHNFLSLADGKLLMHLTKLWLSW
jgi:hypothetical protein